MKYDSQLTKSVLLPLFLVFDSTELQKLRILSFVYIGTETAAYFFVLLSASNIEEYSVKQKLFSTMSKNPPTINL